jgi:hypothetical protein
MNKLAVFLLVLLGATAAAQKRPCSDSSCRDVIFHVTSVKVEGITINISGYVKAPGKTTVAYEAICESEQRDYPCLPVEAGNSYRAHIHIFADTNGQPVGMIDFGLAKVADTLYTITSQREVEK